MAPRSQSKPSPTTPRNFDADLAAVTVTLDLTPTEAEPLLRRFLTHRNNLIVSKAAKAAARHNLTHLADVLAEAFHRFLPPAGDPIKTDPQCWAKNELARTLAAFEHQSSELFLAGLQHHQLEPSYAFHDPLGRHPGRSDTAGTLRGTCALALVQCRDLPTTDVLRHLTPLFTDEDLPVRVNAARAIEQIGTDHAALLLRLRAELASDEPELLGACIGGVLRLEGNRALPWAARFLTAEDDLAHETAFLLAEQHNPATLPHLTQALNTARTQDFAQTLLTALATTRLPEAYEHLLQLIQTNHPHARMAAKATAASIPREDITTRLRDLGYTT